jgi:hypothetical protein
MNAYGVFQIEGFLLLEKQNRNVLNATVKISDKTVEVTVTSANTTVSEKLEEQ